MSGDEVAGGPLGPDGEAGPDVAAGPDGPAQEPRAGRSPSASLTKPLIMLALIVGCVLIVYVSPLHELLLPRGRATLRETIDGLGWWAPLAFICLCTLGISVGTPRLAFAMLAGALFGWGQGFLYAQAGTLLGCLGAFSWARWLGRDWVAARTMRRRGRLLDKMLQHPIATNVLIRVCPVGNNFATNVLFGVSPVPLRIFAIGTFIGTSPETLIYAIFGSSAEKASELKVLVGAGMLALMTIGFWIASRRSRIAADVRDVAETIGSDADSDADADSDSGATSSGVAPREDGAAE